MNTTEQIIDILIIKISAMPEVRANGISWEEKPFSNTCEGDIDIFIYCDAIPDADKRQAVLQETDGLRQTQVDVLEGGHWGVGDSSFANCVETWLMYFSAEETLEGINTILNGEYSDKLDNYYYPTGRCAMLRDMWIRYDADMIYRRDCMSILRAWQRH